jgi:AcrR family transcriptional regulator
MPRYSKKQKAALEMLMKDDVHNQAMKIIEREGLDGLTMERLAADIGVSRGTLYNYFDDKEAVIDFIEERIFEPVIAAVQSIADDELEPEMQLTMIAKWILTAAYEDDTLITALSPAPQGTRRRRHGTERKKRLLRVIEGVVRDGIDSGTFKRLSPVVVAEVFAGSIIGMIGSMALSGEFYRADAVVPTFMELVLGGLRSAS